MNKYIQNLFEYGIVFPIAAGALVGIAAYWSTKNGYNMINKKIENSPIIKKVKRYNYERKRVKSAQRKELGFDVMPRLTEHLCLGSTGEEILRVGDQEYLIGYFGEGKKLSEPYLIGRLDGGTFFAKRETDLKRVRIRIIPESYLPTKERIRLNGILSSFWENDDLERILEKN